MSVTQLATGLNDNQLMSLIQICESTKRYEDMCKFTRIMAESKAAKGEVLDTHERNLLFASYRYVTSEKRASWRTLGFHINVDEESMNKFRNAIENELEIICVEALDIFIKCQNVNGNGDEQTIFWLKSCGDYYRYLAEFKPDDKYKKCAVEYYKKGMDLAEARLHCTNPTRLGLALNFSVCYYEILKQKEDACNLAKKSFDAAIQELHDVDNDYYRDIVVIMQLLRDNLILWTEENEQ